MERSIPLSAASPAAKGTKWILPVIVVSQFFCTSLWFAGNAILPDLIKSVHGGPGFLARLTGAVQAGFITGTLVFAVLAISDRFSPSRVFFYCSLIAGLFNLGMSLEGISPWTLLLFRGFTGLFLAGIYPVGMKIAADYFGKDLSRSLGFLVGALVLGTAFPHLLKGLNTSLPWKYVVYTTSLLSAFGGMAMLLLVADGPLRTPGPKISLRAFAGGFRSKAIRSAAFGYFGHMWELYTFWAFVPVMLGANRHFYQKTDLNIPLSSFGIIASGGLACVISGQLSTRFGARKIATISLCLSCLCCLLSPLVLYSASNVVLVLFLWFWGLVVIADSPLFSTMVAQYVPAEFRGSSLTIVNCIGFSITIVSLETLNALSRHIDPQYLYLALAAGPILGIIALLGRKE